MSYPALFYATTGSTSFEIQTPGSVENIVNVTLGPNVSIGSNSVLEKCQIENSIIMENCQIKANVNLSGSIIANGSQIEANSVQNTRELLLGERSHLKL